MISTHEDYCYSRTDCTSNNCSICEDSWDAAIKYMEALKSSHNNAMVQCKCHSAGAICHRPIKCGGIPCLLPSTAPIAEPLSAI